MESGVFEVVHVREIPPGVRLFTSRFVDEIKQSGTPQAYEKSRLVVRAYQDRDKENILVQSPTIQRISQRLLLAVTVLLWLTLYTRDIIQAYVQSTTRLNHLIFIKPPPEMGLPTNMVLQVVRPLYGVPEAGNHWYATYSNHFIKRLNMRPSTYDPCLLIHNVDNVFGLIGMQTDDTIGPIDETFAKMEEEAMKEAGFPSKPRQALTTSSPINFNGGTITLCSNDERTITLNQVSRTNQRWAAWRQAKGGARERPQPIA